MDNTLFLAFFYFDFSDPASRDLSALASSLISQLAKCSDACMNYLQNERSSGRSDQLPTFEKLLDMLSKMLCSSGRTFIVIDALDECPESARNDGLLRLLQHICTIDSDKKDAHLLVTSRPETDIQGIMAHLPRRSLSFHDTVRHKEELDHFISSQLTDQRLSWWSRELKAHVYDTLRKRSNGMYAATFLLWPSHYSWIQKVLVDPSSIKTPGAMSL